MKIFSMISITLSICLSFSSGSFLQESHARVNQENKENVQKQFEKTSASTDKDKLQLKGAVKRIEGRPGFGGNGLKDVYLFNESGNIIEQTSVYRDDNREYKKTLYRYDKMGIKVGAEYYKDGNLIEKSVFNYDVQGRVFKQISYDPEGKETVTVTNKFDDKGNLIESVAKMPTTQSILSGMAALSAGQYRQVFTYDENGNQNSEASYMPGVVEPMGKQIFIFNQQNQKIEQSSSHSVYENQAPRISKGFYTYNRQGDVANFGSYESITESNVKEVQDRFKVIDKKNTVQNGYLISDKPGMILWNRTTYEYEYDSHGNWIKRTEYLYTRSVEKPIEGEMKERVIQYF